MDITYTACVCVLFTWLHSMYIRARHQEGLEQLNLYLFVGICLEFSIRYWQLRLIYVRDCLSLFLMCVLVCPVHAVYIIYSVSYTYGLRRMVGSLLLSDTVVCSVLPSRWYLSVLSISHQNLLRMYLSYPSELLMLILKLMWWHPMSVHLFLSQAFWKEILTGHCASFSRTW